MDAALLKAVRLAEPYGLDRTKISVRGYRKAGLLHQDRACVPNRDVEFTFAPLSAALCARCTKGSVMLGSAGSSMNVESMTTYLERARAHFESVEAAVPETLEGLIEELTGRAGPTRAGDPFHRAFFKGSELAGFEDAVITARRKRRSVVACEVSAAHWDELRLVLARDLVGAHGEVLAALPYVKDELEALARVVAGDPSEFLVTLKEHGWMSRPWLRSVLLGGCVVETRSEVPVLRVPAVVVGALTKMEVLEECIELGPDASAVTEAVQVLLDPQASSEVRTLAGAVEVARAL
jgi:hypothetical protein